MGTAIKIREAIHRDYEAIHALNELAVPHVNSIRIETLKHLHEQSISFGVAHLQGQVAGYLLALDQDGDYDSMNYQWFVRTYSAFTYVDRIVVSGDFRRRGIAEALYTHLIKQLPDTCLVLTCEVNTKPENPGSMAFHTTLGFKAVGEQTTEQGAKSVCMLAKTLAPHTR